MTTVTTLILSSMLLPGITLIPETAILVGASQFELAYDISAILDPAILVVVTMDLSLDGGITWFGDTSGFGGYCQFTRRGGSLLIDDKTGLSLTKSTYAYILPEPTNANRKVKGSVNVSGGSVVTAVTLTVS